MYRSLIKSNRMVMNDSDAVMIDTNELIARKLNELNLKVQEDAQAEGEFWADPDADRVAALLDDREDASGDGAFSEGLGGNIIKAEASYAGPTPEELAAKAQEEIEEMKQAAREEIEQEKLNAREAGHKEGFEAGRKEAMREAARLEQEFSRKAASLEAEYEQKLKELEPRFVETLTGIYEHVLKVNLSGDTKTIMFLAGNAIRHIEGCREFLVHVSRGDYPLVNMQKKQLAAMTGNANVSLEVIADATLSRNECMIETEGGIFDCGIGTQMEELSRQLKLLSYSGIAE